MAARLHRRHRPVEGSEAFREVIWVLIEELHPDGRHLGRELLLRPATLDRACWTFQRPPTTLSTAPPPPRPEFVAESPVIPR